ncbi:MAG TPA: zinc ribbon domain-containing protein [Firmicutes bacterium]|nr:zinc ribbon domain-containing protein [Bacillota bacterium]
MDGTRTISWVFLGGSLVIAGILAYLAYRDAKTRDANPVLWAMAIAIAGLMLPPLGAVLGFLVYMMLRPRGKLLTCPHCGRKYISNLAFCPHCGKEVKKECLRCHETMELDATVCPHCRMKVS